MAAGQLLRFGSLRAGGARQSAARGAATPTGGGGGSGVRRKKKEGTGWAVGRSGRAGPNASWAGAEKKKTRKKWAGPRLGWKKEEGGRAEFNARAKIQKNKRKSILIDFPD
jgi:hypothetical protein